MLRRRAIVEVFRPSFFRCAMLRQLLLDREVASQFSESQIERVVQLRFEFFPSVLTTKSNSVQLPESATVRFD